MSEYMPEDMSDRMPEDMSDRMPEDLPDRMPEDMPEDMPDHMPEDMPDRMPNRMSEDMSDRMPEDMPDRMSNRMSEDMSDRMPEDLPVRKCINVMVGITRSKVIFSRSNFLTPKFCHHPGGKQCNQRPNHQVLTISRQAEICRCWRCSQLWHAEICVAGLLDCECLTVRPVVVHVCATEIPGLKHLWNASSISSKVARPLSSASWGETRTRWFDVLVLNW